MIFIIRDMSGDALLTEWHLANAVEFATRWLSCESDDDAQLHIDCGRTNKRAAVVTKHSIVFENGFYPSMEG